MPVIAIWIFMGIALGLTSFVSAWRINSWLSKKGRIAVVGREFSGKTTLLNFMAGGTLSTTTSLKEAPIRIKVGEREFLAFDTKGEDLRTWRKSLLESRNVFYLFDASRVASEDATALKMINADIDHLKVFREEHSGTMLFTVVGTHTDLFANPSSDPDRVLDNAVIQELLMVCGSIRSDVVLGSLASRGSSKDLVSKLMRKAVKGA